MHAVVAPVFAPMKQVHCTWQQVLVEEGSLCHWRDAAQGHDGPQCFEADRRTLALHTRFRHCLMGRLSELVGNEAAWMHQYEQLAVSDKAWTSWGSRPRNVMALM